MCIHTYEKLFYSGLSDGAMNQMGTDLRLGVEESIPLRPLAAFGNPLQQPYPSTYKVVE